MGGARAWSERALSALASALHRKGLWAHLGKPVASWDVHQPVLERIGPDEAVRHAGALIGQAVPAARTRPCLGLRPRRTPTRFRPSFLRLRWRFGSVQPGPSRTGLPLAHPLLAARQGCSSAVLQPTRRGDDRERRTGARGAKTPCKRRRVPSGTADLAGIPPLHRPRGPRRVAGATRTIRNERCRPLCAC